VDVLVIASGFLLRVLSGALAVDVYASPWLFLCTGLLASFLGFGKRAHELQVAGARSGEQRQALSAYNPDLLRWLMYATGAATVGAYLAYTLSEHTREFFHTSRMVWTVPLIAIALARFVLLVGSRPKAESPTEAMLRDPLFMATGVAWGIAVTAIIYTAR
jgi:hypothetical protein